ncbi:MAG TPA: hypothetical protein VFS97_03565, partial [Nitrososphaeraceae archaeon]|nr:hypothetical protein [Nitrososphaeraceae archaeon]
MAIILGKVWHNPSKSGLYLTGIDLDNQKAIEEVAVNGLEELAKKVIVEQHKDDKTKAHVLLSSHKPFPKKSSDNHNDFSTKLSNNQVPAIEVKGLGSHGILFVTPSIHKNGESYQIIGTKEPAIVDDFVLHIDNILGKYEILYLDADIGNGNAQVPIEDLFRKDLRICEGHNRHEALMRVMESLIVRNSGILSLEEIKSLAQQWNSRHCSPPLDDKEVQKHWRCATEFIARKNPDDENESDDFSTKNKSFTFIPEELAVSEALRSKTGYVKVKGQIVSQSSVYNMISAINLNCNNSSCGYHNFLDYRNKPILQPPVKEVGKCPICEERLGLRAAYQYTSTVDIELQNPLKFSEIECIYRLFEKDTENIVVGEIVEVIGDLHVTRKNDNSLNKPVTMLYAKSIEYQRKDKTELTEKDVEEIKSWTKSIQNEGKSPLDTLVQMFAPPVIGNEHVKEALLMVAANAGIPNDKKRIPKRMRLNALLIGDPSLAKSTLLYEIVGVIPNARYESAQSSTGLSLTAQVSKEEGGLFNLRLGPIPMANGSLCALNEIGQMPISDHKHFLDFMEEGESTINKYGINARIVGNTSIEASANPINNQWIDADRIDNREFPTLTQIIQRFDIICVFRETTDPETLRQFAKKIDETARNNEDGVYDGFEEFVKKYLMYAKTYCPTISEGANTMLTEYWIKMAKVGIRG